MHLLHKTKLGIMKKFFFTVFIVFFTLNLFAQDKPNIVMVVMDNLGYGELGCYGGGILRGASTPRIDKLADQGMQLLNFNTETQCVPSRSALLTGRHPIRSGTTKVVWGQLYGLTQWEETLAEVLLAEGYSTAAFGKWHLGDSKGRYPTDQGFEEWYGIPNTSDESVYSEGFHYDDSFFPRPYILTSKKGQSPEKVKVYDRSNRRAIDDELVAKTIDFIERSVENKNPFFAYVPLTQVHVPAEPSDAFRGKTGNGDFADVLAQMDYHVGLILDVIDNLGIDENTIVMFLSENGAEEIFPHNGAAGPWRGTYFTALEGGLRAPFIIRWPNKVPAGSINNEIVHITDLYTTTAKFAGAKIPKDRIIDGLDQTSFFLGNTDKSAREGFPVYNGDLIYAYKWRDFKVHFITQASMGAPRVNPGMPRIYNLLRDMKEEYDLFKFGGKEGGDQHYWVLPVVSKLMGEHKKSLQDEPPIKLGTPDPYTPQSKN